MRLLKQSFPIVIAWATFASPASATLLTATGLINPVPDGGMTAILLGGALAVLAVLRRFVKR